MRRRSWVPDVSEDRVQAIAAEVSGLVPDRVVERIDELTERHRLIHDVECLQLNPAANVMNPRAEAALSSGLGSRPSLGYPGDKYEMGLEAAEQIEVIAAELACTVFGADFAEIRVASGAMANLYAFMACCAPGDSIIAPPGTIGGHVTHHGPGAAGLYGLDIVEAPIDPHRYVIDVDALREMARRVRPAMITVGASLNLHHHPVAEIRSIADEAGAVVLFDAAHLSGLIAGGAWPNPLAEGAHIMTCSTYKSLGGPPSGLLVTNDAAIAERVDAIAFPGLTANFDLGTTAALAIALADTQRHGSDYANEMVASTQALVGALVELGADVVGGTAATRSHAFALRPPRGFDGDGHRFARHLRSANILTSAIGLPDRGPAVRVGTNEIVRWGMTTAQMPTVAALVARASGARGAEIDAVARVVTAFRTPFDTVHYAN
jgi:glycine hydroxymethyltransferase